MGKKLIASDLHFSTKSSILTNMRDLYSEREINCINSLNWVEEIAEQNECDEIIYGGDIFDKSDLTARELTALQEITWANINHSFLVGNHEGLTKDLNISSAHLFKMVPNSKVISKPELNMGFDYNLMYLPYIIENDRKTIKEYFENLMQNALASSEQKNKKLYVISHNDIKMHYGIFESTIGFDIEDIEKNCTLFLNGHLHNGSKFCKNGYNIGNLTGQNFSEDAFKYKHQICILDTDTGNLKWIENPFAFNFYKIEIKDISDLQLQKLKNNAVITVKAPEDIVSEVKNLIKNCPNIKASRVIALPLKNNFEDKEENIHLENMNYLDSFIHYIKENLEINDVVMSELSEVCKYET